MKLIEIKGADFEDQLKVMIAQEEEANLAVETSVREIYNNIKQKGFEGVREYSKKFDHFDLTEENFLVTKEEIRELAKKIDPALGESLKTAIERIKAFHSNEVLESFESADNEKNRMGQKVIPLSSAAVYVPGGEALYPSTLYMTLIPAIIAGVKRIVVLSPPRTFEESPEVAFILEHLNISEVYRVGGAQAVFAASMGAGPLEPVDKIVGPGNIFVATAKQMSYGKVDIDMIAGPSEILVIADSDKEEDIPLIAADLLSQAEHGPAGWTGSFLVGTGKEYLLKIKEELYRQANQLPDQQKNNALKSLDKRGAAVVCDNLDIAAKISNYLAPEHLELFSESPYELLEKITNAGSVFLGKYTPESVGDYVGGPNHVLPTARTARFFSPLGVYDFQKRISWIEFKKDSLEKYIPCITNIARSEKLEAHARSAEIRFTSKWNK